MRVGVYTHTRVKRLKKKKKYKRPFYAVQRPVKQKDKKIKKNIKKKQLCFVEQFQDICVHKHIFLLNYFYLLTALLNIC